MEFVKRGATEFSIEQIQAYIENNDLAPNDKLPSEREWCEELNVSRSSIRRAIEHLEGEGVIYAVPQQGIFVSEQKIKIDLTHFTSFSSQMKNKNIQYLTEVISVEEVEADADISKMLNIKTNSKLMKLVRKRSIDSRAFSLQVVFLSDDRFPGIAEYDFEKRSLYEILNNEYDTSVCEGKESISLVKPTQEQSKLLNVGIKDSLISSEGLNYDSNQNPVEYVLQYIVTGIVDYYAVSFSESGVGYDK